MPEWGGLDDLGYLFMSLWLLLLQVMQLIRDATLHWFRSGFGQPGASGSLVRLGLSSTSGCPLLIVASVSVSQHSSFIVCALSLGL